MKTISLGSSQWMESHGKCGERTHHGRQGLLQSREDLVCLQILVRWVARKENRCTGLINGFADVESTEEGLGERLDGFRRRGVVFESGVECVARHGGRERGELMVSVP